MRSLLAALSHTRSVMAVLLQHLLWSATCVIREQAQYIEFATWLIATPSKRSTKTTKAAAGTVVSSATRARYHS